MKLTRLKIHGFKSFVDAADIPIQPGVTGIVGPNGCGKSNLVEALRFVMGESSYKAMRGGGMDDVIFSGAGNRPARNIAEVTIVCELDAGASPNAAQGAEILEVARRIERDSGSTYRINGREARARDVQLLFADAATGAHSSALVRQGQIAELIAAKPVQRRGILEDAAGISGLHSRRGEAEGKLAAAEANLLRLDDVMSEISSSLEALRRQARQASRYRKLSEDIRGAEALLFALQWEAAVARHGEAEAALASAVTGFAAAAARQAETARNEAVAAKNLPDLRDKALAASAALQRVRLAAQELDRDEASLKARRQELAARRGQAEADLKHESEIGADAAAATARIDAEEAKLREEGADSQERIEAARASADAAAAAVIAVETEYAATASMLAAASAERAARERAHSDQRAKLRRLEDERLAIIAERDRLHGEFGGEAEADTAAAAFAEAEAALAEREAEALAGDAVLAAAREAERFAGAPFEAAERDHAALQAEARTLTHLLDIDKSKRSAPLIDSLDVAPDYEKALVAALGDDLDISVDPDAAAHWGASGSGEGDARLPDGAAPLSEFVRGPEDFGRRLRQIGVVTEDAAAKLLPALAAGQRLVTLDGGLWRWDGLRAQPGSAATAARRLESRNRVAFLVQELRAARQDVEAASGLFEQARQARAEAERLEASSRNAIRDARRIVEARRATALQAERHASRIAGRLSAFSGALARIEADLDATRSELTNVGEALKSIDGMTELEAGHAVLQARLAEARGHGAGARVVAETAAHEEATRSRRAADLAMERERWGARVARAGERTGELNARLGQLDGEIDGLPETKSFEARRRSLLGEIGAAEQAAGVAGDALAAAETEHRDAREAARDALEAFSRARETRARDDERAIAAGARKGELAGQIREHFGRPPQELRGLAGFGPDAALPEASGVEARLGKLRSERERLGGINLRAEEEAREVETRLDVMRREREDLEEAVKRLRQGIQSLNREGRERLLAAFEVVNGHFRSLFQHLFGGGAAELTLTGSDDPLQAGLDILARPPGKRPQTMTLLSGGEQALTALSLIFAVFLTNPSPICVLDEVDAPLDDANVERFCALLDEMRKRTETRFLVVTHNPITMARMDRLYGITMAERGVSQIVSVDLEAAERFREAS